METNELHRGRLFDHIQLVVRDLKASQNFYEAVLATLGVPMGGLRKIISGLTNYSSQAWTALQPLAN